MEMAAGRKELMVRCMDEDHALVPRLYIISTVTPCLGIM